MGTNQNRSHFVPNGRKKPTIKKGRCSPTMKITVLSKQAVKRYKPQGVSALIAINDLDEIDHK